MLYFNYIIYKCDGLIRFIKRVLFVACMMMYHCANLRDVYTGGTLVSHLTSLEIDQEIEVLEIILIAALFDKRKRVRNEAAEAFGKSFPYFIEKVFIGDNQIMLALPNGDDETVVVYVKDVPLTYLNDPVGKPHLFEVNYESNATSF